MNKKLFYEDLEIGMEIPTIVKHPTKQQLVKWAGATGDYYPAHYDKDFALSMGLPEVIVQGFLSLSFLQQMVYDYFGVDSNVKKLGGSFRGIAFPGEDMICKGNIVEKYVDGKENIVKCEMWIENPKGERITLGNATVDVPSRN
jgi:acyl dehydratase